MDDDFHFSASPKFVFLLFLCLNKIFRKGFRAFFVGRRLSSGGLIRRAPFVKSVMGLRFAERYPRAADKKAAARIAATGIARFGERAGSPCFKSGFP
jgi:hypothetical protein